MIFCEVHELKKRKEIFLIEKTSTIEYITLITLRFYAAVELNFHYAIRRVDVKLYKYTLVQHLSLFLKVLH